MFGEMARRIRVELDKRLESRGWSVVVGRAYGAYLTHKIQSFCVRAAAVSRRVARVHRALTRPRPLPPPHLLLSQYITVVPGVNVLVWKA
jgi:hypothetical protein